MIRSIHQVVTNFSRQDAVGTDAFLMREALQELGFESQIYFEESSDSSLAFPVSHLKAGFGRRDTAILFHFCIGSDFAGRFVGLTNKKIVRYHNVTPPGFFWAQDDEGIRRSCSRGRQQIQMLAQFSDGLIADSAYNAAEFLRYRPLPNTVLPVFRDYEALSRLPSQSEIVQKLQACGKPIILYVGRICPNKAQDDLLALVARYKFTFNDPINLVLVGGFFSQSYKARIEAFAAQLGLGLGHSLDQLPQKDVCILGKVDDEILATLYRESQVYCSMSEHEGFGVPLVEAQRFNLPILAHDAAAVSETLGPDAVLFDKRDSADTLVKLRFLLKRGKPESSSDSTAAFEKRYGLAALKARLTHALQELL